jgi:hypothetical protein
LRSRCGARWMARSHGGRRFVKLPQIKSACSACLIVLLAWHAVAQDLEPRAYSNTPIGFNFLIAGYGHTEGSVAFDPSLPIDAAKLHTNALLAGYSHSFAAWGNSAKFDIIVPQVWLDGSALVEGQPRDRNVNGSADPKFRIAMNFYGAPALSMPEFADYHQDIIVGASLQVAAPWGRYDASKLVNIGANRWSFKPELGISKAWGKWVVEVAPGVTFYTDNTDFFDGGTLEQQPIYSVQGHIVRSLFACIWVALDGTYYSGGRTTVNGVKSKTVLASSRAGLTIALPINRHSSLKLYGSTGTSSRTSDNYTAYGIAWQYRWGEGFD